MSRLQRHHKIPKHFCSDKSCPGYKTKKKHTCGIDNSSNIEYITIAEHADRHKQLFLTHGHEQDAIAWHALSGQISGKVASSRAMSAGVHQAHKTNPNLLEYRRQHAREIGWKNKGRARGPTLGKIWITNGIKNKAINPDTTIPEGWYRGRWRGYRYG